MKAPERLYVEVCEDGIFAFPEPPFAESVEYIRADINKQPVEGLEEEYKKWWESITGRINIEHCMEWYMHETARHFAEWGARHAKTPTP